MLLDFKTKNYKSFREETVFPMTAAPKQKGLDYSLSILKSKKKTMKGLCSSVIYGPNASGKTNIIGAMDTFRAIVLRGNIKNSEEQFPANPASSSLELIPNKEGNNKEPVEFSIAFYEQGMKIEYRISMDIGNFLDEKYSRRITMEELKVDDEMIFYRNDDLELGNFKTVRKYMIAGGKMHGEDFLPFVRAGLDDQELFLTNGFKAIYAPELVQLIVGWFTEKFMVICRADYMQLVRRFSDPQKKTVYVEKTVNEAAKIFGIYSNALGYAIDNDNTEARLCSFIQRDSEKMGIVMPADMFESYGTIRFVNLFPLVIRAIKTGGTLVVDEFDASLHPMALMSIINIFHNDEVNIHHAQLIFNTHNPIFLNSNLFRRDEIKFIERDNDTD